MTASRSTYELRRFSSSADEGFAEALNVYLKHTPAEIRTNANEITQWVDAPPTDFAGSFCIFGFYRNDVLVGFAEGAFLERMSLFAMDYVVIDSSSRRHPSVFSEFADHLRDYLEEHYPTYTYVVAEIAGAEKKAEDAARPQSLIRLLRTLGFQIIVAPYVQPRLTERLPESEVAGSLMLLSRNPLNKIRTETYLAIVSCIYYDYYLPWMAKSSRQGRGYKKRLDTLLQGIKESVSSKAYLVVNGHRSAESIVIHFPNSKVVAEKPIVGPALVASGVFLATSAALVGLQQISHESWTVLGAQEGFALVATLSAFAIFSKGARTTLKMLLKHRLAFSTQANSSKPTHSETENAVPLGQDDQLRLPPAG